MGIKIGFSRNPWARVGESRCFAPDAQLLATEKGDIQLEKDRHQQFADEWIEREWFRPSENLLRHIQSLTGNVVTTKATTSTTSTTSTHTDIDKDKDISEVNKLTSSSPRRASASSERAKKTAKKIRNKPPTKTDFAQSRHKEFKLAIFKYWQSKNGDIDCPWGPAEGAQLEMWLRQSPNVTSEQFTQMLRNRYRSEVNHGERPSVWIKNITAFTGGRLDRFGKPLDTAPPAEEVEFHKKGERL
jgi:hypothetical protein